ncbi:MAG: hypothetical protein HQL49_06875 [Gammaproteobacteria bacterium]|nr:hypothetical protein [Gammaproteobacteria bacterium]
MTRSLLLLCLLLTLYGFQTIPAELFKLSESTLEERSRQSRYFATENEVNLISSGIGVLQDMGYAIDEIEKDLGVVTASKNVDATDSGQVAVAIAFMLLGGKNVAIDKEQKIRVSFITLPSKVKEGYIARVTFQRIVWNDRNVISRVETLNNDEIYLDFFEKLSKSVFLEAHKI